MRNLQSWLVDTIKVASVTGINYATGKLLYGVPVDVACRVETETKVVKNNAGEEVVSNHNIVTLTEIKENDRVWLPGKDSTKVNESQSILSIESAKTKTGSTQMWTVYL